MLLSLQGNRTEREQGGNLRETQKQRICIPMSGLCEMWHLRNKTLEVFTALPGGEISLEKH